MKRNTLLLLILAVLVGAAVFIQQGKNRRLTTASASVKMRALLLPDLPVNDVRKIRVREGDKQVNLAMTGGKWTVAERSNYPASFDKISRALMSLRELKIAGGQPVKKADLASIKLLGPEDGGADSTGMLVELMNEKGDTLASFIAGKTVETTGGASAGSFSGPGEQRFVRVPKDEGTAWLVSDTFSEFQPAPQDWVDKAFIDVRKLKSASITAPQASDSWGGERKDENAEFTLMEPKGGDELDTAKASGLSYLLSNPTFTDVVPKDQATPDFMKGAVAARLSTFEDFVYDVKVVEKKEPAKDGKEPEAKDYLTVSVSANIPKERPPVKDEKEEDKKKKDEEFAARKKELEEKLAREKAVEGWIFEVSNYTINTLLKKRSEILRDKPKPPPTPEIKLPAPGTPPTPAPATAPPAASPPPATAPAPAEKKIEPAKPAAERKPSETKPPEKKPATAPPKAP